MAALLAAVIFLQVAPTPPPARILRLADAEAAGIKNQPAIKQAHATTTVYQERASEAKAPLFPQVTAIASYQRVRGSARGSTVTGTGVAGTGTGATGTTGTTGTGGSTTQVTTTSASGVDVFTFGANANQLIWDFGQTYGKYQAADRLASAFEASEKTAEYTVVVDVRRAYFTARAQRALVKVAEDSLANLQRHLDQIQGFVQVGTRPEIDLAQAKTDVANGRVSLITAQNAYSLAKTQLSRAIGDTSGGDFEVADDELPPVDGEDLDTSALTARAIAGRPELVALKRQREGQELTVKAIKGGYGPSLSASGGYFETGTDLGDLGPAWNVGVQLTWPIFQGGITKAQVREAEANMDVTDAQLQNQKLQIEVDVQQAALSLRAAKATAAAADEVVVNAKERLRLAEGRYANGVGSAIELGDAQVAVTQAEAQVVSARFNMSSARADLLAAMGRR